jgi:hypothetical protein
VSVLRGELSGGTDGLSVVEVAALEDWSTSRLVVGICGIELVDVSRDPAGIPNRRRAACAAASRGVEGRSPLVEVSAGGVGEWETDGV